jgi:hypothetical protein
MTVAGSSWIMALMLDNRYSEAVRVQSILTRHGCMISMRLGLHETRDECAPNGLILLHLRGEPGEADELERELHEVQGVNVKKMELSV